jgi:hypothetical protein
MRHHPLETIEWDGIFTFLQIGGQSTSTFRNMFNNFDLFRSDFQNIVSTAIKVEQLFKLINHPAVKFARKKQTWEEAFNLVGKERSGCSMYAETTPVQGCPLHAPMNMVNRVMPVTNDLALADMIDIVYPHCRTVIDPSASLFKRLEMELYDKAKVKIKIKSRFKKTAKDADGKHHPHALKQPHGSMIRRVLGTDLAKFFPSEEDGTAAAPCPNLRPKLTMIQDFEAALYYVLATPVPCDYFEGIPLFSGCVTQATTPPPEESTASCKAQCSLMSDVAAAFKNLMDTTFPPIRKPYGCYAWKSVSSHLFLSHILQSYCEDDCETQPNAAAQEAQHLETKLCYFLTGRCPWLKVARFTSQQQAHHCTLGSSAADLVSEKKWQIEVDKWKSRHNTDIPAGRKSVRRAIESLWIYEQCKMHNREVLSSMTTNDDGTVEFTRTETGNACFLHDELNTKWRFRGTTEEVLNFVKPAKTDCACVEFYKVNENENEGEEEKVPFKSDWCAFKDIKSNAADDLDIPLDEEEQPDEEDLLLEYEGG